MVKMRGTFCFFFPMVLFNVTLEVSFRLLNNVIGVISPHFHEASCLYEIFINQMWSIIRILVFDRGEKTFCWWCLVRMSTVGVWVWVRSTWRNTHERKFGDSRCPLDDCSNVHLKLAFVFKGTVGKVQYDLILSCETWVAKLKIPTETQRKLAVHGLRYV